jgi:hypothetical protein
MRGWDGGGGTATTLASALAETRSITCLSPDSPPDQDCPRHRFDLSGGSRDQFAIWILDGTFSERDLTDDEVAWAQSVAIGRLARG